MKKNQRYGVVGHNGAGKTTLMKDRESVNRGQREHKGSFRGYLPKGGGAVFS